MFKPQLSTNSRFQWIKVYEKQTKSRTPCPFRTKRSLRFSLSLCRAQLNKTDSWSFVVVPFWPWPRRWKPRHRDNGGRTAVYCTHPQLHCPPLHCTGLHCNIIYYCNIQLPFEGLVQCWSESTGLIRHQPRPSPSPSPSPSYCSVLFVISWYFSSTFLLLSRYFPSTSLVLS